MLRRSNVGSATARKSRNKVSAPSVANRLARAVAVERLEERWVLASITANNVAELISAINTANANNESDTIVLSKQTYTLTAQDNFWYGPNGLPAITSDITIDGNGATIERSSAANTPKFRLFYVAGGTTVSPTLSFGTLTLNNLTLQGGLAKGGDGGTGAGGGLGAGGAIFTQGVITLDGVLVMGNTAQGGSSVNAGPQKTVSGGGGGMGGDGGGSTAGTSVTGGGGGGMGGRGGDSGFPGGGGGGGGYAGNGGSGSTYSTGTPSGAGGGGGGLIGNGGDGTANGGGAGGSGGGGGGGIGTGGPGAGGTGGQFGGGGGGGSIRSAASPGGNGGFGGGGGGGGHGFLLTEGNGANGGNGGVGGGGGGSSTDDIGSRAGNGGYGGGGGASQYGSGGNGGFGGGGGSAFSDAFSTSKPGTAGFGGGDGKFPAINGGGGGAGLGGAIFVDGGTASLFNSTFTANTAAGGTGGNNGQGIGGAVFVRDGSIEIDQCTLTENTADKARAVGLVSDQGNVGTFFKASIFGQSDNTKTDLEQFILGTGTVTPSSNGNLIRNNAHPSDYTAISSDPMLAPLADNGGYTRTFRPLTGSPVIDGGAATTIHATDQRGPGFVRLVGAKTDIGAYERGTTAPTVTINQGLHQSDPAVAGPIHFDVVFSESVTGFDASDVDLSAGTAGGTLAATVTGSGSLYFIKVTGMNTGGTVIASVKANAASDLDDNLSTASTSVDNVVTFEPNSAPTTTGIADKTVLEDSGTAIVNLRDFFGDNEDGAAGLTYTIEGNTNAALFSTSAIDALTDQLSLTPAADANGAADITIRATDAGGKFVEDTFSFNVTPVTDILIGDVGGAEGSSGGVTAFVFPVTRDNATGVTTVDFATADGTAGISGDYLSAAGSIVFADGETEKSVTVYVRADVNIEPDQDFFVNLTNPSAGSSITRASGRGLIISDDVGTPGIAISDVSVDEGNSGTKVMTFTVTLDRPSDKQVTVKYATANGTATSGTDYTAKSGTLTFFARQTTATVSITIKGDTSIEGDESFRLNLSAATNATITDNQGVGVILNDDRRPVLTVADVSVTEGTGTGTVALTFTVKLDKAATSTVTVAYATANGTASSASDYTAKSGTLSFAAGELTKTVTILVKKDALKEADETLFLNLSALTGPATLGRAQAKGTIRNDD